MSQIRCVSARLLALMAVAAGAVFTPATHVVHAGDDGGDNHPLIQYSGSATKSLNWAGYIARGDVTEARSEWIVPAVHCAAAQTSHSSTWVGIDGDYGRPSSSVEQVGTRQGCSGGRATYDAFYQLFPGDPIAVRSIAVSPGDRISARITCERGSHFNLRLANESTGATFSKSVVARGATCGSAEWIVERMMGSDGALSPLADINTVTFRSAAATINGEQKALGGMGDTARAVSMVNENGALLLVPSRLNEDRGGFSVRQVDHR